METSDKPSDYEPSPQPSAPVCGRRQTEPDLHGPDHLGLCQTDSSGMACKRPGVRVPLAPLHFKGIKSNVQRVVLTTVEGQNEGPPLGWLTSVVPSDGGVCPAAMAWQCARGRQSARSRLCSRRERRWRDAPAASTISSQIHAVGDSDLCRVHAPPSGFPDRGHRPGADLRRTTSGAGPSRVRGALQRTAPPSQLPAPPARPNHPVADLSQKRIKRRPVLGGLIIEYERAA